MNTLTLRRPDDWHLHLRDGAALHAVAPATAAVFQRALVMPNLRPPVRTVAEALAYRERILEAVPQRGFCPLMTLYLTDHTTPEQIAAAAASEHVLAAKLYPAGATTNSDAGVTNLAALTPVLEAMAQHGLVLCVHGEVTQSHVDIFDREARFLTEVLAPLIQRHPTLRVVLEHITTAEGVDFVASQGPNVAGTLTAHHLLLNRNALFEGGIRPHRYCLPVLKRERHREALVAAAVAHPRLFLGTDSAPHAQGAKESACGCAGMYTAPHALGLYAEVFEDAGALSTLEAFASLRGPAFYNVEPNASTLTLVREPEPIPPSLPFANTAIVPFRAGGSVRWRIQ